MLVQQDFKYSTHCYPKKIIKNLTYNMYLFIYYYYFNNVFMYLFILIIMDNYKLLKYVQHIFHQPMIANLAIFVVMCLLIVNTFL